MLRCLLFTSVLLLGSPLGAADPKPNYDLVEVAPTRTSIYIGTVSMTTGTFERKSDRYVGSYSAKVFPYFFSNEKGTLTVNVTNAQLQQLAKGQPIEFTGQALRTDGAERRVTGKAVPKDANTGALKVRVYVSKRIELIFNTTYRFP